MDWQKVLFPVSIKSDYTNKCIGSTIYKNNGENIDLENINTVFIAVEQGSNTLSNTLRHHLYSFRNFENFAHFADLGDYTLPKTIDQSHIDELGFIISDLIEKGIAVITYCNVSDFIQKAIDRAFEYLNTHYSAIESNISIAGNGDFGELHAKNWLSRHLSNPKSLMHYYAILGYQSNHVANDQLEFLQKMGFEAERLGNLKNSIQIAEPYIRSGNFLHFNYKSIKTSYTGLAHTYPNGFNGEEACAILKYAGANNQMQAVNLFAENWGQNNIGAEQFAQMIWYFMDGTQIGFEENPITDDKNYT
ncbi:MAG: hypothetical protein ACPGLV_08000, partial [Bacteroidia bacterium]